MVNFSQKNILIIYLVCGVHLQFRDFALCIKQTDTAIVSDISSNFTSFDKQTNDEIFVHKQTR